MILPERLLGKDGKDLYCHPFFGGNHRQGERMQTQKPGIEPGTSLLWYNSANRWATVPPNASNESQLWQHGVSMYYDTYHVLWLRIPVLFPAMTVSDSVPGQTAKDEWKCPQATLGNL